MATVDLNIDSIKLQELFGGQFITPHGRIVQGS